MADATMLGLLVLLFVVLPFVELLLLVWVGQRIGFWETFGIVVVTGVLGGVLAKHQGARAWREITGAWRSGRVPGTELVAGALFLVGAAFLLTPGIITDIAGLLLMVPVVRRMAARLTIGMFAKHATVVVIDGRSAGSREGPRHVRGDVEYEAPGDDRS